MLSMFTRPKFLCLCLNHVSLVYSAVEHPAWWQMINFDVKFNFKNYVLGPENLWLCCPANQKCMIWSYDCGARVDMSTLTPGREAGSRGSVKWVRCGVWDEHWGQIDSDLTVVWGPSIAGIHSLACMHACILEHSGTFWNILEHFVCIL